MLSPSCLFMNFSWKEGTQHDFAQQISANLHKLMIWPAIFLFTVFFIIPFSVVWALV